MGLISLLLTFLIKNVNAVTFSPYDFSIAGNSNLPNEQWVDNGSTKILTVATSMQENNLNINERNYIEVLACVAGGNNWGSYISNDSLNGALQNGNVNYLSTGISCNTTSQSYGGKFGKFYFKVYKWAIPGGQDVYEVSSYWKFWSNEASLLIDIRDIKVTDSDNFYNDSLLVSQGKGQDTIISQNDTIINTDISDNDKHLPSKGSFEDFKEAEKKLTDKVKEADTSVLSIGIDSTSSSWVWDTLTSLIKSNTIIFGMFIAILSIGVIKLGLGR